MYYTDLDGRSYPAKQHIRRVNGSNIITWSRDVVSANILEAEAGTNGFKGGDTGHGSRSFLRLADLGGSDIVCRAVPDGIEIELGGDCELRTVIEALKWMTSVLEIQAEIGR